MTKDEKTALKTRLMSLKREVELAKLRVADCTKTLKQVDKPGASQQEVGLKKRELETAKRKLEAAKRRLMEAIPPKIPPALANMKRSSIGVGKAIGSKVPLAVKMSGQSQAARPLPAPVADSSTGNGTPPAPSGARVRVRPDSEAAAPSTAGALGRPPIGCAPAAAASSSGGQSSQRSGAQPTASPPLVSLLGDATGPLDDEVDSTA